MSILVAGKLALVTGAGSGIGREICRVLVREGATVVAADQNIKTAQETVASLEGAKHIALHINVEDRNSVETAFKDVVKQFSKPPTIIVNSAGIYRRNFLTEVDDNIFDDVINTNLKGAGSGIGREVCRVLAREGAIVVATGRNITNVQETVDTLEGAEHIALNMNVNDRNSVETAFKDVVKQFSKPPTIIVNSAGIYRKNILTEVDDNTFDDVINTNLKGTFLVMQTAVKTMIEGNASTNSSIINISSIAARGRYIGLSTYSASKAGMIAMTKSASLEFGQLGIRINAVLPGFIETPMTANVSDKDREMLIKQIPLQRLGKPEDVAEVIVFLASDKSSYINGASIEVSGGL